MTQVMRTRRRPRDQIAPVGQESADNAINCCIVAKLRQNGRRDDATHDSLAKPAEESPAT